MKYAIVSILLLISVLGSGCGAQGDAGDVGPSIAARTTGDQIATVYTYEVSGAGVTFSADIHAYPQTGFAGNQIETDLTTVLLGAGTNTYTATGESMIANFTLNTGAGVLTIVTKKNGTVIRTDTINTNATAISISN